MLRLIQLLMVCITWCTQLKVTRLHTSLNSLQGVSSSLSLLLSCSSSCRSSTLTELLLVPIRVNEKFAYAKSVLLERARRFFDTDKNYSSRMISFSSRYPLFCGRK